VGREVATGFLVQPTGGGKKADKRNQICSTNVRRRVQIGADSNLPTPYAAKKNARVKKKKKDTKGDNLEGPTRKGPIPAATCTENWGKS